MICQPKFATLIQSKKGYVQHKPMGYGGDDKQRAAPVSDALEFIQK